jgi:RNA polymerase sigma-70 factor (ECF subfamily)
VRYRAIDALRRSGMRPEVHANDEGALALVASGALPETQVLRCEAAEVIRRALDLLPDEQRAVVDLAYYRGLTHVEIAERLQVPLGTVKGRMRLALLKLRGLLDPATGTGL